MNKNQAIGFSLILGKRPNKLVLKIFFLKKKEKEKKKNYQYKSIIKYINIKMHLCLTWDNKSR